MKTILLALLTTVAAVFADEAEYRKRADQCRALLKTSLVDFYLPHCLDKENGGYFEVLDKEGKFANNGEKFLTLQARQLWFFSTLAIENVELERSLAAAKHGFEFIASKFHDAENGGYYSKVTEKGEPKDTRKHAYLNAFTIYAFSAYYNASRDERALTMAKELFAALEEHAYDKEFGGYREFFNADWSEVTEGSGYVGALGHKTYNTHLHLMEAFAELYRRWPDARVLQRLNELININVNTVLYPKANANVDAFERDWKVVSTERNLRASYGHDVECIWLVMDAAQATGAPTAPYRTWATKLAEYSYEYGYDREHGGFFEGGPLNGAADNKRKTWWVQNEATVGMLEMFAQTGEQKYYDAFAKTLDFCANHQVAKEGGWWATRNADGSPANDKTRTSPWQGAYHAGRAMIECAKRLDTLADKAARK